MRKAVVCGSYTKAAGGRGAGGFKYNTLFKAMATLIEKLEEFAGSAWNIRDAITYGRWKAQVRSFLKSALPSAIAEFDSIADSYGDDWEMTRASHVGLLEGLVA